MESEVLTNERLLELEVSEVARSLALCFRLPFMIDTSIFERGLVFSEAMEIGKSSTLTELLLEETFFRADLCDTPFLLPLVKRMSTSCEDG
jgi:hypothetical protein